MEAAVTTGKARAAAEAPTIAHAFRITVAGRPDQVAIRTKEDAFTITWGALMERVDALAGGLAKLGLERGETLALMLGNRPEFHICDLAGMMLGATPFSIYNTYTPEQIRYLLTDAESRILICEQEYLPRVLEARKELPELEHVIVVDGEAPEGTLSLTDVEGSNPGFDVEARVAELQGTDLLTLIYTSGTTGPPKGVQLIHRNLLAACEGLDELISFPEDGRVISWLPSAHVAERNAHHYLPIVFGLQITCCDDPRQVLSYLPEVRPSWFFAVPRIWEKLKAGLETMIAGQPEEQAAKTRAAIDAAIRKVRLEQADEEVPAELAEEVGRAEEEIFSGLRIMLGLDQVEAINVGAAPTPVEVLEFFHAIGLPLAELWGMSETCGAGTVNPKERIRLGTVGPPAPGVQIKLDSDGEVLVKSDVVMVGYRNLPEKTAETFTDDGWLRTGDIGEFDEEGYLKIVDRKKELIISAAGKNMSPANIEATLKSSSPLIGQACTIGDARHYNTALIVLDADFAPVWASKQGIAETDLASLAREGQVAAAVQEAVDAANEKLAKVEQIKRFTIVAGDWLPGGDELTPTMKLKRKPIAAKYEREIEDMYPSS
jgi:long-chain acyl-CoA synthetase